MDEVITLHGSWASILVFVMPIELDRERKEYKPLPKKPSFKQAMLENDFWIIGGRHSIAAMTEMMNDPNFLSQDDIGAYCSFHEIVVVWSFATGK